MAAMKDLHLLVACDEQLSFSGFTHCLPLRLILSVITQDLAFAGQRLSSTSIKLMRSLLFSQFSCSFTDFALVKWV